MEMTVDNMNSNPWTNYQYLIFHRKWWKWYKLHWL